MAKKKRTARKVSARKSARKSKGHKRVTRRARVAATPREGKPATRDRRRAKTKEELPLHEIVEASAYGLHDADVENALRSGDERFREHLERLFGEALVPELQVLSREASRAPTRGGPAVLILPGIMGSKLGYERWPIDDTIWVDPIGIAAGHLMRLAPGATGKRVTAIGVLLVSYLKLKLSLRLRGIDASFFPYDWRLDIRGLGEALAKHIENEHAERGVTLVGHSMGGLVARRALKVLEDKGKDKGNLVRSIVMLGTPNHGSYAPVLVLRKLHELTGKIAALDLKHSLEELVGKVFGKLEGLLQLLPPAERCAGLDLLDAERWPGAKKPEAGILRRCRDLGRDLSTDASRMVLVAGVDRPTFVGAHIEQDGFVFQETREGDGTVPLAFAKLDGVTTYYSRAAHGSLPNDGLVIDAVADLVRSGTTQALPKEPHAYAASPRKVKESELTKREVAERAFGGRRGTAVSPAEVREILEGFVNPTQPRPFAGVARTEVVTDWSALSAETVEIARKRQRTLDIRVALGDVTQVDARAIVLGVFDGVEPSGAATAVDRQLEGAIRDLVEHGLLRGDVGQIFVLPTSRQRLRAEHVVFVGLGQMDRFDDAVRHKVARNVAHTLARAKVDDFATVLLGGGSGGDPGSAMASMVLGFLEALQTADAGEHLRRVTICEHDRARFETAVSNLRVMMTSPLFDEVRATLSIEELPPPLPAPRGWRDPKAIAPDPVYLNVRQEPEPRGNKIVDVLHFSLLTADGNATVLVGDSELEGGKLDQLLNRMSNSGGKKALDALGQWIANELLPRDVREGLVASSSRHLVVVNDGPSSRIPWEAMRFERWTPATAEGISRKFAAKLPVTKWLTSRPVGERLHVLLVVNPTEDLDGAEKEGELVRKAFDASQGIEYISIEGPEATKSRIQEELRSGRYDVMHYAGHAFYDPEQRERSGLLCHGEVVFSSGDLLGLESLPALAVINACESARVRRPGSPRGLANGRGRSPKRHARSADSAERVRVKASLAEAFLRGGITGYVGTYWPVGDAAAESFAKVFYGHLLKGDTVSDALVEARKTVERLGSVDWADYIHYGTRTLRLLQDSTDRTGESRSDSGRPAAAGAG